MTREETLAYALRKKAGLESEINKSNCEYGKWVMYSAELDFTNACVSALKGPTREQVILCKDCRYWQDNNGGYPHPECRWSNDETPDADDYCSFAERLEVNKDG